MNILLLNPPGKKLYIRDYYCSKVSKAGYLYEPVDFLLLSGTLSAKHAVYVLDAIALHLSPASCLKKIESLNSDLIISLTGAVSFYEDVEFWNKIKNFNKNILIFATGDIVMEQSESLLKSTESLDGILLDFSEDAILDLIEDRSRPYNTIIHKYKDKIVKGSLTSKSGEFEIPVPRHELFPIKKYIYPFIEGSPFATVLTDYGCPYRCSFCIMSTLPYKYRGVEGVMEELRYIKDMRIKNIYFSDQTFGAIKERAWALCERIIDEKLNFRWCCFSRVDLADRKSLKVMKKAGCHTVMYGVESGNDAILKKYNKNISCEQTIRAFELCKKLGLKTVATFVLGLPEDTESTILETIEFAKKIEPDYASFNIYVPRMHTELRKEVLEKGLISADVKTMDQSGSYSVAGTNYLSASRVWALKERAVREFHLRPGYLIKRIKGVDSIFYIKREMLGGFTVVRDILRNFLRR